MMKFTFVLLSVCVLFSCGIRISVGTADDVGAISGQLLTQDGTPVNYPVTVILYRTATEKSGRLLKIKSAYIIVKKQETSNGEYRFDSLPSGDYRIEVAEDEIVVACEETISLIDNPSVENSIIVEAVMTLPFKVNDPEVFSVLESFIDNSKVINTDTGYTVKTVKSNMDSLKIVVSQSNTIDTIAIRVTFDTDTIVQFDIVNGPEELRIISPNDTTTEPLTTAYSGMKLIHAGSFTMGSSLEINPNASDTTEVTRFTTLTHDFWLDSTEVTQQQFTDIMTKWYPSYKIPKWDSLESSEWHGIEVGGGDNYPASWMTWIDAILYCNARTRESGSTDTVYSYAAVSDFANKPELSEKIIATLVTDLSRSGFHLPTEAQWEYACRAGTTTDYYFDASDIDDYAWIWSNCDGLRHPVALRLPNAFGLYDMCGNVSEWCNDNERLDTLTFEWGYDTTETIDPVGPEPHPQNMKMLRGGSTESDMLNRSFDRISLPYDVLQPYNGFRTCKTLN